MLEAKDTGGKCSPKKKTVLKIFFSGDLQKNSEKNFFRRSTKKGLQKKFLGDLQNFNNSKISAVLEPRTRVSNRFK